MSPSIPGKIIELKSRKNVYDLVKKYQGCHFRDLERKSKFPPTSLRYHLNYLHKYGIIIEEKDGGKIRYFTKEFNMQDRSILSLLRQERIRKILLFFIANDKIDHESITRFINLSPSTVSWYLKKLESKNIIRSIRDIKKTRYILVINKKDILHLLINYQESFLDSLVNKTIEAWDL